MNKMHTFAVENQLKELNSDFVMTDDSKIPAEELEKLLDQIEAQSPTPPPCRYTVDEMVERVLQATANVEAGRGLMTHEEFTKLVRSWYH